MQIPQLQMRSQLGQIAIKTNNAKQLISQPQAELTIKQPKAELKIQTTPSKMTIDQSKAWEDMNLMGILRRTEKIAAEGKQEVMNGIARRARQGNQLMKIEQQSNPIQQQSIINAYEPYKSLGIKFIPSAFSVKTDYQPAEVNITVRRNEPIIQAKVNQPQISYQSGDVEISLKQQPELDIWLEA
ncbi:hypothetical conserved protein [Oceanobacillus iheyensis HTE831]|uniref:Hypothetical conserved protein n=1 Tax=Oceanobacillus iheyensis (strain DSM 14371 / CIP 107618 / JCM 11309 / KCTC 3954 / HTE831) TaxID=221109 RepID=Q8ENH8_OCEIH|nr:DUF6470 family protein [Oceanobacillus iheyensis]BAC14461.1 hypothetical conserved protein [Oceanobacillus iheyensis HTE831]